MIRFVVLVPLGLDHAVNIVGFGTDGSLHNPEQLRQLPYYIIRNTWGQDWGEAGYRFGQHMYGIRL